MQFGPFNFKDAENIKEILNSQSISFEMVVDKDLEREILHEFHQQATLAPRQMAGKLDLRIILFEVDKSNSEKVATLLEKFGVLMSSSDGSFELGEEQD
jgi:hypothetical protein